MVNWLFWQPRKYEAVMGEFLKTPNNAETAQLAAQVRSPSPNYRILYLFIV